MRHNPSRAPLPLAAALCVVLCAAAPAQITYTAVIAPSQPAPGSLGNFNGPQNPACQAAGRIAVTAFLRDTPNPGFDSQGVWEGPAGGLTLKALLGQTLPGVTGTVTSVSNPTQNRVGAVAFPITLGAPAPFNANVALAYAGPGAGLASVAVLEGTPAPGVPGAEFGEGFTSFPPAYALNDAGVLAFGIPLRNVPGVTSGVFTGDAATRVFSLLARVGGPAPIGGTFTFFSPPAITPGGAVAFSAQSSVAPFFAMYVQEPGGALQKAYAPSDPAPGILPSAEFSFIGGLGTEPPTVNDRGEFAFAATARTPQNAVFRGLWRGRPGALTLVAREFDPAPGPTPSATWQSFGTPMIARSGAVITFANLNNSPVQPSGLFVAAPGGPLRILALANDPAPGLPPGTMIVGFNASQTGNAAGWTINNRGEGVFLCSLNYVVSSTPATGIFAGRPGRLRKVVASGDVLEVAPGVTRTVLTPFAFTGSGPDTGRQTSINDRGEVAFSCSFVGGGGGTFIARLPDPCPGDATGDDLVTFEDLNAILASVGQAVPPGTAGDLNGDGFVNFNDLNIVLAAFGATCE